MAKFGPDDVLVLLDGRNLGIDLFETPISVSAQMEDSHTWGDTFAEMAAIGVKEGEVGVRGFYDDATDRSSDSLVDGLTTQDRVLVITVEGNAQGQTAVAMKATQTNVARLPGRAELTKISADFMGDGVIDEAALIVQSHVADSGAGVMSDGPLDNAAQSTNGGRVYLEVSALTLGGYTSMQVKLQESSDNGGDAYADVVGATSAAITAAPASEVMTVAAGTTIERFTRAFLVLNGAGSSESITALVALARD